MLEYILVVVVLVAAITGMQIYMKRAYQGRIKYSYGAIGQRAARVAQGRDTSRGDPKIEQPEDAVGQLFSPRWSNSTLTVTVHSRSHQTLANTGERVSTVVGGIGPLAPRARSRPLPPHDFVKSSGLDDFSNKRMRDEQMFE